GDQERLQLLLELADELPELTSRYADHSELLEQVHEDQYTLCLTSEVNDDTIHLGVDAHAATPTSQTFVSIFHIGLDGYGFDTSLGIPDDFYTRLGIMDTVSPLRIRGLAAMLGRIKNNVRNAHAN